MTKHSTTSALFVRRPAHGFTLVELLVVIGIIAIILSLLLPSVQKARMQAKSVVCMSNLRQLSLGILNYATLSRGYTPGWNWEFPDPGDNNGRMGPNDEHGMDYTSKGGWNMNVDAAGLPVVTAWMKDHNFFQQGLVWPYVKSEAVYVCPEYPPVIDRRNAATRLLPIYGFDPQWTYQLNANPANSSRVRDTSAVGFKYKTRCMKLTQVKPSPAVVIMVYEPDPQDNQAWWYGTTTQLYATYDPRYPWNYNSVGHLHNGGGSVSYFDGHVEHLTHKEFLNRLAEPDGYRKMWGLY